MFLAVEISYVIHMAHQCRRSGSSRCVLSSRTEVITWNRVYYGKKNILLDGKFGKRAG